MLVAGLPLSPMTMLVLGLVVTIGGCAFLVKTFAFADPDKPARWGKHGSGPRISVFGKIAIGSLMLAAGFCLIAGGYFARLPRMVVLTILFASCVFLQQAMFVDAFLHHRRRRQRQAKGKPCDDPSPVFKKHAHAYTLAAVAFGMLGMILSWIAVGMWKSHPPQFFGGGAAEQMGAWIPTLCLFVEVVLITQAMRYWLSEVPQEPGADYLDFEEDPFDSNG